MMVDVVLFLLIVAQTMVIQIIENKVWLWVVNVLLISAIVCVAGLSVISGGIVSWWVL